MEISMLEVKEVRICHSRNLRKSMLNQWTIVSEMGKCEVLREEHRVTDHSHYKGSWIFPEVQGARGQCLLFIIFSATSAEKINLLCNFLSSS